MPINLLIILIIGTLFLGLKILPVGYYITARISGANIPLWKLINMQFNKINVENIVNSYIVSHKAALQLTIQDIEGYEAEGGDSFIMVKSMISARQEGIELSIENAMKLLSNNIEIENFIEKTIKKNGEKNI